MGTIAFIGLGHMGGPMAANQLAAGHTVRGYDVDPATLSRAAESGVTAVGSIAEALEGADVCFTMVPKGEHARAAYLEDGGVLAHADPRTLLVDSSTIDVESAQALHDAAAKGGFRFLDAPVSGGTSGAVAGTLTFMVGGDSAVVEEARQWIDPMAGNIIATGGPTSGQAAKICNNMMLFINLQGCAEGAVLADKLGLDPQVFWDIASVSTGQSWALKTWYPVPGITDTAAANNEFAATFSTALAAKDAKLALAGGKQVGVQLPAAELVSARFDQLMEAGGGDLDCSAIVALVNPAAAGLPDDLKNKLANTNAASTNEENKA